MCVEHMAGAARGPDRMVTTTLPLLRSGEAALRQYLLLHLLEDDTAPVMVRRGQQRTTNSTPGWAQVRSSFHLFQGSFCLESQPLKPTMFSGCQSNLLIMNEQVF